jgi:competence protein ComEC
MGMVSAQWLPVLPPPWVTFFFALCALGLIWRAPMSRWFAIGLLGFAWALWRGSVGMEARLPRAWEGQDFVAIGQVVSLPETKADATGFLFRIDDATLDGKATPWRGLARISWYHARAVELTPCSHWQLTLRLRRPHGLVDPGGGDSERSAIAHGIDAVGYVRDDAANRRQSPALLCIDQLRAHLTQGIQTRVSDAHDAALLRAFTVGDTGGLNENDWDVARANGVSHLIAISGFHVGVAALFGVLLCVVTYWLWPSLALRWPKVQAQALSALVVAFFYAAIAGFGMPTVRTVLMIAAVALTKCSRRAFSAVHALALASIAILVIDPLAVLEAGFWLSFVGVGFLVLCLETQGRGVSAFLRDLTLGQLVMTVALLPLTQWFFGEASLVGALSNLLAVPIVSFIIVPCALIGLLVLLICPPLATPVLRLAAWLTHMQWWVLEKTAAWPGAHWFLPEVKLWTLVLATLGAAWLFMPRGIPLRALGALLFLPLIWPVRQQPDVGAFQAWMLDVGQGLSMVVRTRDHVLVYDTGALYPSGFDLGEAVVIPSLHALGMDHLDVLMISHGDNDHAGGAPAVAKAFPAAKRYAGEPQRMTIPMEPCSAGQHWEWDGVRFDVLSPATSDASTDNDRSCVLLVTGTGGRLLLTGDIDTDVESRIVRQWLPGLPLVLQVPHHGSRTSSSPDFIATTNPELAIVSTGWLNRFGHPRPEVLQRYASAGVPVLNTALEGAIQIDFPARTATYAAIRWRQRQRRYWRE